MMPAPGAAQVVAEVAVIVGSIAIAHARRYRKPVGQLMPLADGGQHGMHHLARLAVARGGVEAISAKAIGYVATHQGKCIRTVGGYFALIKNLIVSESRVVPVTIARFVASV